MREGKPFIHTFTTNCGYYAYDVNTNRILSLRKPVFDYLNCGKPVPGGDEAATVEHLVANGFLSPDTIEEIAHPDDEYLEAILSRKLRMLCLQVTQNCNLRCEYCAYSGIYRNRTHANRRMDFETARKGIDFYASRSGDNREMTLAFYGGEPFLEFGLLEKCCEYVTTTLKGKPLSVYLTTNGTLMNDEILAFLREYGVRLTISLDGPREIHNRNRKFAVDNCGSFDRIMKNIEFVEAHGPAYLENISFSATTDERNDFSCINTFFMSYGAVKDRLTMFNSINPNDLVSGRVHTSEDFHVKREYEVFKMFLSRMKRLDEKLVSPLVAHEFDIMRNKVHDRRTPESTLSGKRHPGGPCIPGAMRLFMSADGTFYPCERVSETSEIMKIGHVDRGFDLDKIKYLLNVGKVTEKACKRCWAFRFCYLCASLADGNDCVSKEKRVAQCGGVRHAAEEMLKNYCTLRELGYDFD